MKNNKNNSPLDNKSQIIFNKIYFGPPGTGKSHKLKEITLNGKAENDNNIFRVTFYEDYSYYDFIGQYKPTVIKDYVNKIARKEDPKESEKEPSPIISYDFVPGIFIQSYISAYNNPDEEIYLIIEEINRGNCSAIFGDVFQLLDRNEFGSKYPIKVSKELENYLRENLKNSLIPSHILSLPKNLKILATMNTSDQSLFAMDSAFKRRWQQEYCHIDYKCEQLKDVTIADTDIKWLDFIEKINNQILIVLNSEDKQLGQWFTEPFNEKITKDDFKYKVISYLFYDVFKHHRSSIFNTESFSKIIEQNVKDIVNGIMAKNS